jgi:hypothetical protein
MTTAAIPAIRTPSVIATRDFSDAAKYVVIKAVPLFDAHDHPRKGNVDLALLRLLTENTNARVRDGHPPGLICGHTDDDLPEHRQPITVGAATGFRVAMFNDRPTIFADFHVLRRRLAYASTYPYRSIERIASKTDSWNAIVAIALLRREPDRKLGMTSWPDC